MAKLGMVVEGEEGLLRASECGLYNVPLARERGLFYSGRRPSPGRVIHSRSSLVLTMRHMDPAIPQSGPRKFKDLGAISWFPPLIHETRREKGATTEKTLRKAESTRVVLPVNYPPPHALLGICNLYTTSFITFHSWLKREKGSRVGLGGGGGGSVCACERRSFK